MKRSEMLEFLRDELKDIIDAYNNASDRARLHRIRAGADGILAMIEGMGMLPPINDKLSRGTIMAGEANEWETEDGAVKYKRKINVTFSESNLTVHKELYLTNEQIEQFNNYLEDLTNEAK